MNKEDWEAKEKDFLDMLEKANENKVNVEKQIEELNVFLKAVRNQVKIFKS